jgi:hypothetical protein
VIICFKSAATRSVKSDVLKLVAKCQRSDVRVRTITTRIAVISTYRNEENMKSSRTAFMLDEMETRAVPVLMER